MEITDSNIASFIDDTKYIAGINNVDFFLSPNRKVKLSSGAECNGFFEDHAGHLRLVVAAGQPIEQWMPILIHESCHMDQCIEQCDEWTQSYINNYYTSSLISMWVDRIIELSPDQLNRYISVTRAVELDCEERSVEKIKKYNLPIDVDDYIQRANSYIYFYTIIEQTRKWYSIGNEPYNTSELYKMMPTEFYVNSYYGLVPDNIHAAYMRLLGLPE